MLDHGARDVTAGLPEVKEYPGLLGFERPDTASDILGIIPGEETGDVVAEVRTRHRDSRRHTPGQVQRHFDADGSGLLETGSGLFFFQRFGVIGSCLPGGLPRLSAWRSGGA